MALALALIELLTVNAKIIELYLESLTEAQRQANATQIFELLASIHTGLDKVFGLIHHDAPSPSPTTPVPPPG